MPHRPTAEQPIAAAGFGLQQAAVGAERLAYCGGMDLEGIIHDDRTRPDAIHQFVLGDELAG